MKAIETKLTIDQLKKLYEKHGGTWEKINLFGISDKDNQQADEFNDVLGCEYNGQIYLSQGTTDPGWNATVKKDGGAAHVCDGFHKNIWTLGVIAPGKPFEHECFTQYGDKVKIWRDINRDGIWEKGEPFFSGYFGICRHRASNSPVEHIGPYSEGCQVHQVKESLLRELRFAKETGQKFFSYLLIDKSEVL